VVDEAYQNMKIGTELYSHLEQSIKKEKISYLCCEVNVEPPNPGSARFHKRRGFDVVCKGFEHEKDYSVDYLAKRFGGAPKPQINAKVDLTKPANKVEKEVTKNDEPKKEKPAPRQREEESKD